MHICLSEDELYWIDKKPFEWTVKKGCPEAMKKNIEKKLKMLQHQEKVDRA